VVSALAAGGAEADELRALILGPPAGGEVAGNGATNGSVGHGLHPTDDADGAGGAGGALPPLDPDQIARATYLVEACGGREWTAVRAKANLDAALGALERVRLSAVPHRDLADIAVYVVERES
jgi:hypothetical protein